MYISIFNGKFHCYEPTKHWDNRKSRKELLLEEVPKGYLMQSFYVDRGHRCGAEIHHIFSNGIIVIVNAKTKRLITKLIARPMQIYRYYQSTGLDIPEKLVGLAYINTTIKKLNV